LRYSWTDYQRIITRNTRPTVSLRGKKRETSIDLLLKTHVSLFLALAIQDSARMPWHDTSLTIIGELGGFFANTVLG
jgi:hypothetical protein